MIQECQSQAHTQGPPAKSVQPHIPPQQHSQWTWPADTVGLHRGGTENPNLHPCTQSSNTQP